MAYSQNSNQGRKGQMLFHNALVKSGPTLVRVVSPPKWVKGGTMCVVTVERDNEEYGFVIENQTIEESFKQHVGQTVVLLASGDGRKGNAAIVFQPSSGAVPQAQSAPQPYQQPQQQAPTPQSQTSNSQAVARPNGNSMRDAKIYFHQAANLMRISVKKADDLAKEFGLPNEHRQGIATTLFIQAERKGYIAAMPIDPLTPAELGWAQNEPAPQQEAEDTDLPY